MVKYEDECVHCGDRCLGNSCPNRHVKHLQCDECDDEIEELYDFEGIQLCEKCLLKKFEKIT